MGHRRCLYPHTLPHHNRPGAAIEHDLGPDSAFLYIQRLENRHIADALVAGNRCGYRHIGPAQGRGASGVSALTASAIRLAA